jgi:O-antigen/teichoic acid export membrane protein
LSTAKKFAGQTAIYGVSTVISRTLNFFLTPILAGALPASVYGIFTKMYSYASILNAVISFGMETTFFRYLNKHPDNKSKIYSNSFFSIVGMAFAFFLATIFFAEPIATLIKTGRSETITDYVFYIKCFIYILIADALCVIPFAKLRADGRPGRYSLIKFLNVLLVVSLNLFFLFAVPYIIKYDLPGGAWMSGWYKPHWVGYVFVANLAASALTLLLLLPEILQLRLQFDWALFKQMLVYSSPVLIANISFIINENIDKLMLGWLLPANISDQEVGIYGACAKIALFLSIFIQAFRLGAEPFFFSHAESKNSGHTYARIMHYFVIAICLIFLGVTANVQLLKYFIRASDPVQREIYWSGLRVVPLLLFGYVNLGIYMNLSVWYKLSDQTKYGLYISGIGAILTVILNWIFIPKYSYMASAWVSLIAYSLMMVLSYIWGQKNYYIPYDLKKSAAYIFSSLFLVYISFYVFNRNIFIGNGLLIAFASVALYFEWKNLKSIFIKS